MTAPLLDRTRPLALLAGPVAVAAAGLFFAALAVHGDDIGAIARGPLGVASNLLALASVLLLLLGLVRLTARPALDDGAGAASLLVAGAGTVLLAGAAWAQLVTLPVFAVEAPRVADEGTTLVTAGYVVSFVVAGLGWLLVAFRLRRDPALARGRVRLLLVGAVLMLAPLPTRWFLLAVAVSLLAATETAPSPAVRRPAATPA
ncbi:MAG TPA: hypothetical protein VM433_05125 [Mycobacteriales bacterium]|nr:hypothetical protein [Mycobacteriales bacterium]